MLTLNYADGSFLYQALVGFFPPPVYCTYTLMVIIISLTGIVLCLTALSVLLTLQPDLLSNKTG